MKGQAAIEFLVLTGFMMLVFTTFFLVVQERTAIRNEQGLQSELVTVAEIVAQEVGIANSVKEGYNRIFELPLFVNGENYSIELHPQNAPSEIIIRTDDQEYVFFLQINLTQGSVITPGYNHIRKTNKNITITEAQDVTCSDDGDCGPSPGDCWKQECVASGSVLSFCQLVPVDEGTACLDDGISCTDNECDGNGVCVALSNCCEDECELVCDTVLDQCVDKCLESQGEVNTQYLAGNDGMHWNWSHGAASRITTSQNQSICCDLTTQCAGQLGCFNTGIHGTGNRVCTDTGLGNQFFTCGAGVDGHILDTQYCCSRYTAGETGKYAFTNLSHPDKQESDAIARSCTDGSDNDCDGLADGADPDCAAIWLNSTCMGFSSHEDLFATTSVTALRNIYEWFVNGSSILLALMPFDVPEAKDYTDGSIAPVTAAHGTKGWQGTGAYEFDGVDDALDLTQPAFHQEFAERTWEFRFKQQAGGAEQQMLFEEGGAFNGANVFLHRRMGMARLVAGAWSVGQGLTDTFIFSNIPVGELSTMNHVALVFSDTLQLYHNSNLVAEAPLDANVGGHSAIGALGAMRSGSKVLTGSVPMEVSGDGYYFKGIIDEFRVYNRALTPEQITFLHKGAYENISKTETAVDDTWRVCTTPHDGTSDAPQVCSDAENILSGPASCDAACPVDTTNKRFGAGPHGKTWNENGATTYIEIAPSEHCCATTTQCPRGGSASCRNLGQLFSAGKRLCEDRATGAAQPTMYFCKSENDFHTNGNRYLTVSGKNYCCSLTTTGVWEFNHTPTLEKNESCDDSFDNDCDGKVDCADAACASELHCVSKRTIERGTASRTHFSNPTDFALDSNTGTFWNAGARAVQWYRIKMPTPIPTVSQLRLNVGQNPSGITTHEIYGSDFPNFDFPVLLANMTQLTVDGAWLYVNFSTSNYQYYTILTTVSPSWVAWREIEAWGP